MNIQQPPDGTFEPVVPDSDFADQFSYTSNEIEVLDTISGARGDVIHCTDGTFEGYVKPVPASNKRLRTAEKYSTLRGYKFCQAIGIPTPAHTFTENWFASEAINGKSLARTKTDNINELLTLLAKSMLAGMSDASPQNIILGSNGNIYFIDLDAHRNLSKIMETIRSTHIFCLLKQELSPNLIELVEARAFSMARAAPDRLSDAVSEEERIGVDLMKTAPFEENRKYILENITPRSGGDIWDINPEDWASSRKL